jgi:hypothetical protein
MHEKMRVYDRAAKQYAEVLEDDGRYVYSLMNIMALSQEQPAIVASIVDLERLKIYAQSYLDLPEDDEALRDCRERHTEREATARKRALEFIQVS